MKRANEQQKTPEERENERTLREHVKVVREGHGANCSSIGSVIDTLFVAQVAAGALLAAVAAALASESKPDPEPGTGSDPTSEDEP